jgi:hypothetical protein
VTLLTVADVVLVSSSVTVLDVAFSNSIEQEETDMSINREQILALGVGLALYLLLGSTLDHYRALIDSMVIAEFISRILKS